MDLRINQYSYVIENTIAGLVDIKMVMLMKQKINLIYNQEFFLPERSFA